MTTKKNLIGTLVTPTIPSVSDADKFLLVSQNGKNIVNTKMTVLFIVVAVSTESYRHDGRITEFDTHVLVTDGIVCGWTNSAFVGVL
jgi:hypothetical protein